MRDCRGCFLSKTDTDLIYFEAQELIRASKTFPSQTMFLVIFHTMACIDEVLRLKWEDVNFEQRVIRLWLANAGEGLGSLTG